MTVSYTCPTCGSAETTARGPLHYCPSCRNTFVARRPEFPSALYMAVYRQADQTCFARVLSAAPGTAELRSEPLNPRVDLWNHSPTGIAYGYAGSGPAQLALGILAHWLGPGREVLAVRLHQAFKRQRIATAVPSRPLLIDSRQLARWMSEDDDAKCALAEWYSEYPFDVLTFDA